MKNWLEDLNKTLGLGLILAFIVFLIRGYYGIIGEISFWAFLFRWIHVVVGILWIGLLYYFNFVQIPSMPKRGPKQSARASVAPEVTRTSVCQSTSSPQNRRACSATRRWVWWTLSFRRHPRMKSYAA